MSSFTLLLCWTESSIEPSPLTSKCSVKSLAYQRSYIPEADKECDTWVEENKIHKAEALHQVKRIKGNFFMFLLVCVCSDYL